MSKYFDELCRSMNWLGKKTDTMFLGQSVQFAGTAMTNTLNKGNVPESKLLEMPVNEDLQMGMTIGLSISGMFPISIFPRWNFLLLGTNQLVNHLDKIPLQADIPFKPRMVIRTGIGSVRPLHPQHQHIGDYCDAFRMMCKNIDIIRLDEPEQIFDSYVKAYERTDGFPTIIVEWGDYYNEK